MTSRALSSPRPDGAHVVGRRVHGPGSSSSSRPCSPRASRRRPVEGAGSSRPDGVRGAEPDHPLAGGVASRSARPAGTADVRPDTPVVLTSTGGRLDDVALTAEDGTVVAGETSLDGRTWTSTGGLAPETTYAVSAVADQPRRRAHAGDQLVQHARAEGRRDRVGAAQDRVGRRRRHAGDRPLRRRRCRTAPRSSASSRSPPARPSKGAWHWISDTEVQYRPRDFWRSGTTVTVDADLSGVEVADGIWGVQRRAHHLHHRLGHGVHRRHQHAHA